MKTAPYNANNNHRKHGNHFDHDTFSQDDSDDDESEILTINGGDTTEFTQTEITATAGTQSIMSSDLESTTFFDTENDRTEEDDDDDDDGQFSSITADTTNSTLASNTKKYGANRMRKRAKHHRGPQQHNYLKHNSLHSSMTSLADSTMSLNIITITLNMESSNFLGISIVGQSNKGGEGGIYVGSIMAGYVLYLTKLKCKFKELKANYSLKIFQVEL
jgi:hypothetical protein